jgi:hypothetical protein
MLTDQMAQLDDILFSSRRIGADTPLGTGRLIATVIRGERQFRDCPTSTQRNALSVNLSQPIIAPADAFSASAA